MEAGQELREPFLADRGHHRQTDRRVHRIPPADPVPETEHVLGVDTEFVDQLRVRRHRDEVFGHCRVAQRVDQPPPCRRRVGQCLQRRERLGGDDEKCCRRVQSVELGDQVGGVDVGDEPGRDAGIDVVAQRLIDHDRPEVGAADADVHHGGDALAGRAAPLAAAQPVGELTHPVEHLVHVGHHVLPVDGQRRIPGQSQRGVQHRPVLGGVDVHAGEHRVALGFQLGCPCQLDKQVERLAGDTVLAVVDVHVADGQRQLGTAGGILGEKLTQARGGDVGMMAGQCLPCGRGSDVRTHVQNPSAARRTKG